MAFHLLSEPIRRYVRNKRWEALRPIQAAAIEKITSTNNHYILASRTASGKTEAAFLPILSKTNFNEPGVQVLYISPLIALINDQFYRIEELCKNLEVRVTKWHGEARRSLKKSLIKKPEGIVLITPESIEAMFVNAPYQVSHLFGNLKYIVIDEIHSFLGVDRGIQLMSLLSRIQQLNKNRIIVIGLSATIGKSNYTEAKKFTGDDANTTILLDDTKKETNILFKYFYHEQNTLTLPLLKDLYVETCQHKVLIFPNNRGRTEEVAVKLRKIAGKVKGHQNYYTHHSSVDKEIREAIEHFAKTNERYNFCICCTSTLELGIDIGTVDKIVQLDSTYSVASLVQRIGRSGRKEGDISRLNLYATNCWSLLQALACWQLYQENFLEPLEMARKPYDVLLHQMLSMVKQLNACKRADLVSQLRGNYAFQHIEETAIHEIIDHCIRFDYLELIQRELIIGLEGELIVNSREFYSVFKTEVNLKVIYAGKNIGEIGFSPQVQIDQNILLSAKIWKIKFIDYKRNRIEVVPAADGNSPNFSGDGINIHPEIRTEMLRLLKLNALHPELNKASQNILEEMRADFEGFVIEDFETDRPVIIKEKTIVLYAFTGTKINKSLSFLLNLTNTEFTLNEYISTFEIDIDFKAFRILVKAVNQVYENIDYHLTTALNNNERFIDFSKWGKYLPVQYKCAITKERYFDFDRAIEFLNKLRLRPIASS